MQSLRNTTRILKNDTAAAVAAIEARGEGRLETLMPHVSGKVGRKAYETGDTSTGALSLGMAVAFADEVEPLAAIVDRLESEAAAALKRLNRLAHA
jgi:NADH:quinone reductase (non-electrogenic)